MKVLKLIIFTSFILSVFSLDTKDEEFVKQFQVKHVTAGDGKSFPQKGNQVKVHYTGTFPETGKKFDSSRDRGDPFTFTLGQGQVIRCWDMVVERMSKGERIEVICPSALAYGSRGAGGAIPPNADIAFDIEMIDWRDPSRRDEH